MSCAHKTIPPFDEDLGSGDYFDKVLHDLGNPLHAIELNAELLDEALDGTELVAGVQRIRRAATRIRGLLRELLDVARFQSDKPLPLDLAPVDLPAMVAEHVARARRDFGDRTVSFSAPSSAMILRLDKHRMDRVLAHILGRVVRQTSAGEEIRVQVAPQPGLDPAKPLVSIRLMTPGPLVFAEDPPFLLAKHIVTQHGGILRMETAREAGAGVMVRLPLPTAPNPIL
jgi:His Kinase A (phospho-acceptor) domain